MDSSGYPDALWSRDGQFGLSRLHRDLSLVTFSPTSPTFLLRHKTIQRSNHGRSTSTPSLPPPSGPTRPKRTRPLPIRKLTSNLLPPLPLPRQSRDFVRKGDSPHPGLDSSSQTLHTRPVRLSKPTRRRRCLVPSTTVRVAHAAIPALGHLPLLHAVHQAPLRIHDGQSVPGPPCAALPIRRTAPSKRCADRADRSRAQTTSIWSRRCLCAARCRPRASPPKSGWRRPARNR